MALDARRRRAVEIIASGRTQAEAGRELGCDRATICRWAQEPEFSAEVEAAQREMTKAFHRDMRTQAVRVSERWATLIDSPDEGVALRALLAWVDKFGGLDAPQAPAAAPADVNEVLAYMRWRAEQQAKQPAATEPQSEGETDAGPRD